MHACRRGRLPSLNMTHPTSPNPDAPTHPTPSLPATHPLVLPLPHPLLQGMPSEKAKLNFVKSYYEFLPKALYTDTRTAADGAKAAEAAKPAA